MQVACSRLFMLTELIDFTMVVIQSVIRQMKTDWNSALCSAPHKADYVDRSIMWTVLCGMALEPCIIWVFGDRCNDMLNIISGTG